MEPVYLEVEVAEMLRVRLPVIRRERYSGRLGYIRVGGRVRIRQSDIDKYVASQCPADPPAPVSSSGGAHITFSTLTAEENRSAARRGLQIRRELRPSSQHTASAPDTKARAPR